MTKSDPFLRLYGLAFVSLMWSPILVTAACAGKPKPAPPTVVIAGCEHFKPISASRRDTDETKEQILAHNAEYVKVCGK